jgi:hypothetical protein
LTWIDAVRILTKIAKRYPQTAYAGMARSLQMEWQYTLRVIPGVAELFEPLAKVIAEECLPALLGESGALPEGLRDRLALPARWSGTGIPDPSEIADECHSTSKALTAPLTHSLRQRAWLDADDYSAGAAKAASAARLQRDVEAEAACNLVVAAAVPLHRRAIRRSKENGAWLTSYPSYMNGTELSSDEFLDNLHLRFSLPPTNLPSHCDGCGQRFSVNHALQCNKGGLVHIRHNNMSDEWAGLCQQALTPSAVSSEPFIYAGRAANNGEEATLDDDGWPTDRPDDRGDVAAHGFWCRGHTTIFDVRITDTDAASYLSLSPSKVLVNQEKAKKRKYLEPCLQRRTMHFTPLVFSADGLRGLEATAATKQLAKLLACKWGRSYGQTCQFVRARLSIAIARGMTMCLRGQRDHGIRLRNYNWSRGDDGLPLHNM